MVIWLIGMSGSGKTTIGKELFQKMQATKPNTVLIDGDQIREIFKHDKGDAPYTISGRRANAERIQALCYWLEQQGIDVVCCILSLFQDIQDNNRRKFSEYHEVFVDSPIETLIKRDNKGLYQSALSGEQTNVVGIDIPYTPPASPDLIINNSYQQQDIGKYVEEIITRCELTK
ncbi:adenylyl-sulfate kinase [Shewanella maritima]|uniref:adenylyl-sulfate kinase n=1 Tax=Shewanella maritima TaxID=2520507 RepID=UPI003736D49D